jgi:DNA polymerase III subunit epsilon
MSWVTIDFETANETRGSACALGVAIVEDSQVVERRSWLIRPPTLHFNPYNVMIHGITAADVSSAPTFDVLWPSIAALLEGRTVVAHYASFDMSVLRHSLDQFGLPWPRLEYVCTCVLAKKVWTDLLSYSLPIVANRCGIRFLHHNPEEDAVASAEVALRCCEALTVPEPRAAVVAAGLRVGSLSPEGIRLLWAQRLSASSSPAVRTLLASEGLSLSLVLSTNMLSKSPRSTMKVGCSAASRALARCSSPIPPSR